MLPAASPITAPSRPTSKFVSEMSNGSIWKQFATYIYGNELR